MTSRKDPPVMETKHESEPSERMKEQLDRNYAAFTEQLPNLLTTQRGKFALMRDSVITEFFDTARDAYVAGQKLYPDGLFSVQEVVDSPADLGYFSHAMSQR